MQKNQFWRMNKIRVKNDAGADMDAGEVLIYGALSEDGWWDDDVTPKAFYDELKAMGDVSQIHVRINSYGGHVSAGSAVYSMLKAHPASVTVHIDGFALSAASVVAMAGDTVIMPGNSMMMIHNPAVISIGDAAKLRQEADVLDKMRDAMITAYQAKSGLSRDELIEMLDAETWFTAQEAVDKGFADVVGTTLMAAACVSPGVVNLNGQDFDLSKYRNPPQNLLKAREENKLEKKKETASIPVQEAAPAALDREAVFAQGRETGITEERARQQAIDEMGIPGMESIIAKAKYDTGDSPEAVAVAIIKAQKQAGETAFAARRYDAQASGVNDVTAALAEDGTGASQNESGRALNTALKKRRGIA